MMMDTDAGRVPLAPGSRPTDQAPSGLGASRFDPSRDELLALAERCEGAAGWDYQLDEDISRAFASPTGNFINLGQVTTSLDAAMKLVPTGWRLGTFGQYRDGRWQATLVGPANLPPEDGWQDGNAFGASRALAAAGLRACAA